MARRSSGSKRKVSAGAAKARASRQARRAAARERSRKKTEAAIAKLRRGGATSDTSTLPEVTRRAIKRQERAEAVAKADRAFEARQKAKKRSTVSGLTQRVVPAGAQREIKTQTLPSTRTSLVTGRTEDVGTSIKRAEERQRIRSQIRENKLLGLAVTQEARAAGLISAAKTGAVERVRKESREVQRIEQLKRTRDTEPFFSRKGQAARVKLTGEAFKITGKNLDILGLTGEKTSRLTIKGSQKTAVGRIAEDLANDPITSVFLLTGAAGVAKAGVKVGGKIISKKVLKAAAKKVSTRQITKEASKAAAARAKLFGSTVKRGTIAAAKGVKTFAKAPFQTTAAGVKTTAKTVGGAAKTGIQAAAKNTQQFIKSGEAAIRKQGFGRVAASVAKSQARKVGDLGVTAFRAKGTLGASTVFGREITEAGSDVKVTAKERAKFERALSRSFAAEEKAITGEKVAGRQGLLPSAAQIKQGLRVFAAEVPGGKTITEKTFLPDVGAKGAFEKEFRASLTRQGIKGKRADQLTRAALRRRTGTDVSLLAGFVGSSAAVEVGGRRILGRDFGQFAKFGIKLPKKGFSAPLAGLGAANIAPLGFIEASFQEAEQQRAETQGRLRDRPKIIKLGFIGAASAGILGGAITGTAGAPRAQTVLEVGGSILDPIEKPGDIVADILEKGAKLGGRKVVRAGIVSSAFADTFTFAQTQQPGTKKKRRLPRRPKGRPAPPAVTNVFVQAPTQTKKVTTPTLELIVDKPSQTFRNIFGDIRPKPKKPAKPGTIVPTDTDTPVDIIIDTPVQVPSETPAETPVPINVFTETFVESPVSTQTTIFTPVASQVSTPILRAPPPIPPLFGFPPSGAGIGAGKGKRVSFVDELSASQGLLAGALGGLSAPAARKVMKKKGKKKAKKRQVRKRAQGAFNILPAFPKSNKGLLRSLI